MRNFIIAGSYRIYLLYGPDRGIHSSVIAENYYNNAGEVMAAMMRPWGHFCGTMQVAQSPWSCNELSSDGAAWPQKGRHGYDNGDWIRLHRHQWILRMVK